VRPFVYLEAGDAKTAAAHVAREPGARLLAGGTTLLDLMKLGVESPPVIVDIHTANLARIDVDDDGITLGALATNADVAAHAAIRARYPVLAEAILSGATPQLRNMATTGGNLLQRTRCPYFRSADLPCNKREPGTGCAAREGVHRTLALLGTSEACIANYPGDMAIALVALDAVVHVEGARRSRAVPLVDLYLLPGLTPARETILEPDEVIVAVRIPALPAASTSRYVKVRDRASYEFALTSAAAALAIEDGRVTLARVALGGVGAKPWRSPEAEAALLGQPATAATFARAAEAAMADARPLPGNAFRVEVARRTVAEALRRVADGERAFAEAAS
jgi:xanthine dehydrogenase YagS FAD-binding subunit